MLVLSRHRDEVIMISRWIAVTITDIRGDKVRLTIKAKQDVVIHRQEVFDAICRECKRKGEPLPSPVELTEWEINPHEPGGLVLSRKKNESIVINADVKIVVVEIRGDKVRLGIEAPKEVEVYRLEVMEAIQKDLPWVTNA